VADNSKERIKFACKELEDALAMFGAVEASAAENIASQKGAKAERTSKDPRQEKIFEIKRQLQNIREQLDSLS
jgi:hypothetical protein